MRRLHAERMSVEQSLLTEGGVARTSRLLRLGHSPHQIRRSIASGEASRPRRGWLALASADPELVLAARHGVVLSCVTQAARLGLWVLRRDELHVAAPRGRKLLLECTPFSDSGLESIFRTRLRWLRIPVRPQCWAHGRRVDFLIGDRLVVQIDGRDHVGRQRTDDNEHDAELTLRGYHVIRVGYEQVVHRWREVEAMILEALARGLHLAR
jgi:very-short-patch-repair endonuclease